MSILFLDFFVGRNRPTLGSRKIYNPDDPKELLSYDVWYILPSRIYDRQDYDSHFILFTLYVHYDCRTKKTFIFCIHRLGSERQASAEKSSAEVKQRLHEAVRDTCHSIKNGALKDNVFAMQLPTITSSVILWTEALHQERLEMWKREDVGRGDLENIDTAALHEVTRYIHSYKTNILFTLRVLKFLRDEHIWFANIIGQPLYAIETPSFRTIEDALDAQIWHMRMMDTYADEVIKRTEILIALHFNRNSEQDSHTMSAIAEESRQDAVSMRTIAIVTLIFLPATFVSTFFSMAFFQAGASFTISKLWLYPVIVIPMTILVLLAWWMWHGRKQLQTEAAVGRRMSRV